MGRLKPPAIGWSLDQAAEKLCPSEHKIYRVEFGAYARTEASPESKQGLKAERNHRSASLTLWKTLLQSIKENRLSVAGRISELGNNVSSIEEDQLEAISYADFQESRIANVDEGLIVYSVTINPTLILPH